MNRPGRKHDGCECNWYPMSLTGVPPSDREMLRVACGYPCVQDFEATVTGKRVDMHRCASHKLSEEFLRGLAEAEHR